MKVLRTSCDWHGFYYFFKTGILKNVVFGIFWTIYFMELLSISGF